MRHPQHWYFPQFRCNMRKISAKRYRRAKLLYRALTLRQEGNDYTKKVVLYLIICEINAPYTSEKDQYFPQFHCNREKQCERSERHRRAKLVIVHMSISPYNNTIIIHKNK